MVKEYANIETLKKRAKEKGYIKSAYFCSIIDAYINILMLTTNVSLVLRAYTDKDVISLEKIGGNIICFARFDVKKSAIDNSN